MLYGELLKELRIIRKFSQQKLVSDISSQTALSRIENSDDLPFNLLLHFLRKLNIRPMEFFNIADKGNQEITLDPVYSSNYVKNKILNKHLLKNEMRYLEFYNWINFQQNSLKIDLVKVKKYLLNLNFWTVDDLSLYTNVLFIFENNLIKIKHRQILSFLNNSSLEKTQKHFYQINYANNLVILAFKRHNLDDLDLYLKTYQSYLFDDPNLLNEKISYEIFMRLRKLMFHFDKKNYRQLLKDVKIFENYNLHLVTKEITEFIVKCLQ